MSRYLIICAMLLTGCDERVRTVYATPHVPADLRQPVTVVCPPGYAARDLALCLLRQKAGVTAANDKIAAIDDILTKSEAQSATKGD